MGVRRSWASRGGWMTLLVLLVAGVPASRALNRRSAAADPTPVAKPNLAALSGLGGLSALAGANGGSGSSSSCNNQDLLTNLLVYQYLSGSIPGGSSPGSNPELRALLGSASATTTVTSVSTSLTTLVVEVEPTTQFTTSTTSYVTTLTSTETKVIPVIFRGSKITTTVSESSEEVITATEYFTESSVFTPSIVQTLPVHITVTATSTRGLNGRFTLANLTPGPTSVVHQPISTATLDLDSTGLDLANLDLSQLDISSLVGSGAGSDQDGNQMLSVLSSLLQQYDDAGAPAPSGLGPSTSSDRRQQSGGFRSNRFSSSASSSFQDDYVDYEEPVDDTPKFNVLRGFTLSDRVASSSSGGGTGRAATDTRYSKFQRKDRVTNNGIATTESSARDRESEPFQASTRRQSFSRASGNRRTTTGGQRRSRAPSTRFVPATESQYFEEVKFRPFGARRDRETTSSRRRSGRLDDPEQQATRSTPASKPTPSNVRTTVLTMYLSGSAPGEFHTSLRTVTLRSLPSTRNRRDVQHQSTTKILPTATETPAAAEYTKTLELPKAADPKEIVQVLKSLDSSQVKQMLKSLQKWVDFYSHEVLDESHNNIVPELTSSLSLESSGVENEATTELSLTPTAVTGSPSATNNLCHAPPTVTQTVYRTMVVTTTVSEV
ncbi:serine-rich adhesin for platelets-like [Penaeus monodon]|uniref:serine-rich adhesin for platelets-like n=1 Tax=Penaeus monodon TaxID=6687 RepID=UPI0018A71B70|nr:serine-rich adhesin for platelets-like [Penaeus monodon]